MTKSLLRRIISKLGLARDSRYQYFEVGFHGDQHLQALVASLIEKTTCFIETGANVGSTLAYVARAYPSITCLSCEPDKKAFALAVQNTIELPNVSIMNATSQEFLEALSAESAAFFNQTPLFWLDAHGYGFRWPLKEEVAFFTSKFRGGYLLIDDFKVPHYDGFTFHRHNDQECSFEYVQVALHPAVDYQLYYPAYTVNTSPHHPLTGWGLLIFGAAERLASAELAALEIRNG